MKIESRPLAQITPYARNPRRNQSAISIVKASLKEYGWQQPIVVDDEGVIIAGHTRYMAALELGMKEVPVHVARDLTPAQVKAYRLMDNKSHERAEWDTELLKLEMEDLQGMEFDLELTGFNMEDLAGIRSDSEPATEGDTEPQIDRGEELRVQWGVETGQLWQLGGHRLLCGDSTKAEDVARVLDGDKPLLMVTDPPYGVEYDAEWRNRALRSDGSHFFSARAIGKVENDDRADWREAFALFPGDVVYIWHAGTKILEVATSIIDCGFVLRNLIIWAKSSLVIGRGHYHHQHESCWYAVHKGKTSHWQGDRKQTTLWDINKPQRSETGHSTQKPLECMARPMRNHDIQEVYEPFSGSGTTIIAGENLGRKVRAIEISPGYVAVALQRYFDHCGKKPIRLP